MQAEVKATTIINTPRKVVRNALIITVILIISAIVVGYSDLDGMKGGYALIFILFFLSISSFITALIYIPRAKAFDTLIKQVTPLAHWTYTPHEWELFIKEDLKEMLIINKATLRLVIIASLVVLGILLLVYQDFLFVIIIAAIVLMLTIVAFFAPHVRSSILQRGIHEAYISDNSAYVGGTFGTWSQLGTHLVGVDIFTESTIPILHIIYQFPTLHASQQEIIRIPVPQDKIDEAKKIVIFLRKQIK
jgi:Flp pilus assembly protein protease CpaA